jgi:non-heme chloroperoxidase
MRSLRLWAGALCLAPALCQDSAAWHDPSPHRMRFVTVEDGVRLEVLDWGGSGRPVVLLTGFGNSAHVFDEFAPKLKDFCHVYGITRRGYGASSRPETGYTEQRLADDVLHVLDSLKLAAPVLAGHSIAGDELTALGAGHSDRLGGLVYFDALADPTDNYSEYEALRQNLPAAMRKPPAPPSDADLKSFQAYRDYQLRTNGVAFPEADFRNVSDSGPGGRVGRFKTPRSVRDAILAGGRKRDYSKIRVPVLAFSWFPRSVEEQMEQYQLKDEAERAAVEAMYAADANITNRRIKSIQSSAGGARVIKLPGANHYVFLSNEAEVLREMRDFMAGLR